ncbi:MAG: alpha-amylase family glycosyl hydrolase, partial [Bacilli bacterium]
NFGGIKWLMRPFSLVRFKKVMEKWQKCMMEHQGWNSLYWENHDQPRSVGRFHTSSISFRIESAKMLAVAMYFHQGTPYIYQGQELGMTNAPFNTLDQYRDTETLSIYRLSRRLHIPKWYIMWAIRRKSRDHARTPMQWSNDQYAGFSTVEPWIQVNPNFHEINVEAQEHDSNSVLQFYRKMFRLRKSLAVVKHGDYRLHFRNHRKIYMYSRNCENDSLVIVANFSSSILRFSFPKELDYSKYQLILSTYSTPRDSLELAPFEARVYQKMK